MNELSQQIGYYYTVTTIISRWIYIGPNKLLASGEQLWRYNYENVV